MRTLEQIGAQISQVEAKQNAADAKLEKRTPISSLPFTISAGGAYYLTSGQRAAAGQNGITVNASNVTIDLNGFRLSGFGTNAGIFSTGQSNIEVRNGTIDGWSHGIDMLGSSAVRIENVRASGNSAGGISVGAKSTVSSCSAMSNGMRGIKTEQGSIVAKCVVVGTTGPSAQGIAGDDGCLIIDSVVRESSGAEGNSIRVNDGNSIIRCAVSNGSGNNLNAIVAGNNTKVIDCVVNDNAGTSSDGIRVGGESLVSGCTVSGNGGDGVTAQTNCLVQNNNASSNAGAGFRLTGDRSRLEGNHAIGNNGAGFTASGGGITNNLIIRNSAASNLGGDYIIGTGNAAAGIVSAANVGANTNPHVNFDLD